ncbi:hypothetical protein BCR37DRAFT_154032 [Protomyces lactucae-debilis]|uniref:Yeast cell wall synthesis Kre9/Knh1-like N-terminal domain-containing protein n=1 Tax=Protomyces lactucae-debilis TaxID=2754530 RepID=A0A1Y2F0M8_PROLT|nr:uncharacterized protein BCR37DRAFT_154032 [Protomyces lactucae-debilis]ORY77393.1 hypothetical protein BCR37DRAFT_154032 [Protomyces lactucae-debilis]
MHFFTLATLIAAASALQITNPAQVQNNPVQYNNGSITVTWNTVSTDPNTFNVALSANGGQSSTQVATNVAASAGQLVISLAGVAPGRNYQVNFVALPTPQNTQGILAQSGQFEIAQGAGSASAATTTAATAATMTTRATTTTAAGTGAGTGAVVGTNGTVAGTNGTAGTGSGSNGGRVPSGSGAGKVSVTFAGVAALALAMLA